ncbi:hypothetical protein BDV32DRAFT_86390 [Aspergillus pseudonomiae]|uniref:Uncharacterized protein n=1 Tax=Aspergillus pseudonomiae TaxID=1506151 RepID=A0A5N6HRQ6_9EURO|nr:uncharacterized protein BDV37DRAFT_183215 [Aspergillus pseudonomiae]KAB8257181.1 hypothetical protein BDV32DRAFT_86390 [Aspergillus pseudonomiae]KAE8401327.1 hypothetical protein BDV37DRAFT_183215 [Aspergillus pseudonomiae]
MSRRSQYACAQSETHPAVASSSTCSKLRPVARSKDYQQVYPYLHWLARERRIRTVDLGVNQAIYLPSFFYSCIYHTVCIYKLI